MTVAAPGFTAWAFKGFFSVLSGVDNSREEVAFEKPLKAKNPEYGVY